VPSIGDIKQHNQKHAMLKKVVSVKNRNGKPREDPLTYMKKQFTLATTDFGRAKSTRNSIIGVAPNATFVSS